MIKILTAHQMKTADLYTSADIGIPSMVLMERAAMAAAHKALEMTTEYSHILVLCGQGGNGGDGFAAARLLLRERPRTEVFFVGDKMRMNAECSAQKQIYENLGGRYAQDPDPAYGYDLYIDAVFGIGLHRSVSGQLAELFARINASDAAVLSLDIPSGVNTDDGSVMGAALHADETVTFQYLKRGHVLYPGAELSGHISVCDVGIVLPQDIEPEAFTYEPDDIARLLPQRIRRSNKGTYGHAFVIAGSVGMAGCAVLCAGAAYAMGTGLVMVMSAEENRLVLHQALPEALWRSRMPGNQLSEDPYHWADAAAIGPGIGLDASASTLLMQSMQSMTGPMVLDADALTIIAGDRQFDELLRKKGNRVVMTPHPGEMSRLLGMSTAQILADPVCSAQRCAQRYHCIVILKDAATVVTDGEKIYVNRSGCDGMASGGSGDVLTGMICGLLAQKADPYIAACLGVYIHGLSGQAAQERIGARSMLASDLIRYLPEVLR